MRTPGLIECGNERVRDRELVAVSLQQVAERGCGRGTSPARRTLAPLSSAGSHRSCPAPACATGLLAFRDLLRRPRPALGFKRRHGGADAVATDTAAVPGRAWSRAGA